MTILRARFSSSITLRGEFTFDCSINVIAASKASAAAFSVALADVLAAIALTRLDAEVIKAALVLEEDILDQMTVELTTA